jgi:FkbM family methyltransferase
MTEKLLQALDDALQRKRSLSRLAFVLRLFIKPRMAFISLWTYVLKMTGTTSLVSATTFWGKKMKVVLPEVVSGEILRFGYIEEAVANAIITYAKTGGTAIDVGGHFGFFSLLLSEKVGDSGRVHVFEPIPSTFAILSENSEGLPITKMNMAVWNKAERVDLRDYGLCYSAFNSIRAPRTGERLNTSWEKPVTIEATTLDSYVTTNCIRPDFVKIDAESAEFEVVSGMDHILREIKPVVCIELGDLGVEGATKSRTIVDKLISYGYRPYEWHEGSFREHAPASDYPYSNLLFLPPPVH